MAGLAILRLRPDRPIQLMSALCTYGVSETNPFASRISVAVSLHQPAFRAAVLWPPRDLGPRFAEWLAGDWKRGQEDEKAAVNFKALVHCKKWARCANGRRFSWAMTSNVCGTSRPSAFAVFGLMITSAGSLLAPRMSVRSADVKLNTRC